MKKILALFLASIMVFALVSCGNSEKQLPTGSTEDNTYENKFISVGCKLDDDWTFLTDEEIDELNNVDKDAVGEEMAEANQKASIIYDMSAAKSDNTQMININLINLGLVYGSTMDESAYIDASIETIKTGLENMGLENIVTKKATVTFAGKSRHAIEVSGEASGIKIYEKVVCLKAGKYMSNITVVSYLEDTTDEILAAFYAL